MKIKIYNQQAEEVGEQELSSEVFGVKVNESLVHQAVVTQLANQRQVLAHTKIRSEVRGGGRKPWRQKGTGRARAGSIRSPLWKGGGVTFGPTKDRNFSKDINIKMRKKAILMALSDKVKNNLLVLLDKIELPEAKTRQANAMINNLENKILKIEHKNTKTQKHKNKRNTLVLLDKKDENIKRAMRNLTGIEVLNLNNINVVDLLKYRNLVLTVDGVKKLEEQYGKSKLKKLKEIKRN